VVETRNRPRSRNASVALVVLKRRATGAD